MLFIFYFIIYLLFVIGIASFIQKKNEQVSFDNTRQINKFLLIGFVSSILITWLFLWVVSFLGFTDWNKLILQLLLSLILPIFLIGFVNFIFFNHAISGGEPKHNFMLGALYSIIAMPWLTFFFGLIYETNANLPEYYSQCKKAEIVFHEKIEPARSVFLSPDLFTYLRKGHPVQTHEHTTIILNQSTLEYIERPPTRRFNNYGKSKYEKISTQGERVLRGPSKKGTKFIAEPTDAITSQYIVTSTRLDYPRAQANGVGGSQIKVHRISDNKLIAHAIYYWVGRKYRSCPDKAGDSQFIYKFIATALNVINPNSNIQSLNVP